MMKEVGNKTFTEKTCKNHQTCFHRPSGLIELTIVAINGFNEYDKPRQMIVNPLWIADAADITKPDEDYRIIIRFLEKEDDFYVVDGSLDELLELLMITNSYGGRLRKTEELQ